MPVKPKEKTSAEKYPEHEKLSAIKAKSQAIGEFLDHFTYKGQVVELCIRHEHTDDCYPEDGGRRECGYSKDELTPIHGTIQDHLAAHFGIDQNKLEDEKRAMLAELRGEKS